MVFGRLDCKPRWRERLAELAMPTLVVHGRRDPFFPVGNGEALAREISGARRSDSPEPCRWDGLLAGESRSSASSPMRGLAGLTLITSGRRERPARSDHGVASVC